jgi:hypothetical protein
MLVRLGHGALLVAALCSLAIGAEPRSPEARRLFSVRSTYNRNEVVFEAVLNGDGFDLAKPIRNYWIVHMHNDRIESLSSMEERLAFGIVLDQVARDRIVFHVRASSNRFVTVHLEGQRAFATTKIRGEESELVAVFATVDARGVIPSVNSVELLGHSLSDQRLTRELIKVH